MGKTLKEMANEKGKRLLIESFSISIPSDKIEVLDNSKGQRFVESANGSQFKAVAIVRDVPVTRFVENLNGRVYSKRLWEKVYKSKVAEGTLCLADHPSDDSDGSVKDIVGIWRDFQINENNCTADLYLVGKHGGLFLEVLQAGGKNGLSTVGFGELQEDERTVNPETYELIRLSDWVITPSQQVYAEQDNLDMESISESVKSKSSSKSVNNTNLIKEDNKRNYNMGNTVQELTVRNNVKIALKESAKALETKGASLVDAKRELQDVLRYIPEEYTEHRNTLNEEIAKVEKAIKETISEKSTKLKESEKVSVDLNQKYKMSNSLVSKLKEQTSKASKIVKVLSENEKRMKNDIFAFSEDRSKMIRDIKRFIEDRVSMKKDISVLMKERSNMLKDIKGLLEDKDSMLEDMKCFTEDRINLIKDIKALKKENTKLKRRLKEVGESEPGELVPPEVPDQEVVQDQEYDGEKYDTVVDPAMAYASDDEDFGGIPFTNYNSEEGYIESRNRGTGKKFKESAFNSSSVHRQKKVNKDVLVFFNEKVKKKPILNKIREEVLKQTSLVQAVRMVEAFLKTRKEKPLRISESVSIKNAMDWVGDNDY